VSPNGKFQSRFYRLRVGIRKSRQFLFPIPNREAFPHACFIARDSRFLISSRFSRFTLATYRAIRCDLTDRVCQASMCNGRYPWTSVIIADNERPSFALLYCARERASVSRLLCPLLRETCQITSYGKSQVISLAPQRRGLVKCNKAFSVCPSITLPFHCGALPLVLLRAGKAI